MGKLELPLILLAGRDRRQASPPGELGDLHLLRGYKAMELEIAGEPLIVRVIERLREGGVAGPIFVAGPARVYRSLEGEVHLVDTDRDFGENIRASVEAVRRQGHEGQVALMTSDVLPDQREFRAALDDFERHQPCDFWMVECRGDDPEKLGASAWKRQYLIRPEGESEPVGTLPGHFFVADPGILRLDLLYPLFELAYRTRNRPTAYRRAVIIRAILTTLLGKDLKRLVTLRIPDITWDMLWNGLVLVKKLVTSGVDQSEMEDRLRRMWVRTSWRRRHPELRGRVMIHDGVSLARDIDTEEEAWELTVLTEEAAVEDPVG